MRSLSQLNKEIKADTRIQIAKIGGFVAFLASAVMTMMSSVGIGYASYCVLAYLGFYVVYLAGFFAIRKDNSALLLYAVLSTFIWITYILKFSLILFEPESFLELDSAADVRSYFRSTVPQFLVLCPALALFVIGLCFGPVTKANLNAENPRLPGSVNFGLLFLSVSGLLLLKFVGQVFFDVGSPMKVGHGLPPLVLALYEFVVGSATIILLNVLFFTLHYMRIKRGIILVTVALVANIALALSAGWKSPMVLQALALSYFFFELRHRVSKQAKRSLFILSALLVSLMLVVYPYVNYYRYTSSGDGGIEAAISRAAAIRESKQKTDGPRHRSVAFQIFDRIGGISTYIHIAELGEGKDFSLTSLWGSEFGNLVKYELYGAAADSVMVQFSATQFAALYLVGGWAGLYFGSFVMGVIFRVITSLLANRVLKYATTFHAYLPFLCFTWLGVLMGGGKIGLTLKSLLVVVVSVMVLERLVFRKKQVQKTTQNMVLPGNDQKRQSRILRPASRAQSSPDGVE